MTILLKLFLTFLAAFVFTHIVAKAFEEGENIVITIALMSFFSGGVICLFILLLRLIWVYIPE